MTLTRLFGAAIGCLLTFATLPQVAAQTAQSPILTTLKVRQLMARAEPTDHVRLRDHFAARADQYDEVVNEHSAMTQAYRAVPNRHGPAAVAVMSIEEELWKGF